jgi:serine/threonine-protein kinase
MLYEMVTGKVPFTGNNAFLIMNDRLMNNPVPPRELDPAITPQLQEIIYRALEREPVNRYPTAREFARALENQSQVGVADRPELADWKTRKTDTSKRALNYVLLAMVPIVIFTLLLWVARHA